MGEIQYVWGDPDQPNNQVALSSIVRAMQEKKVYAIARWVTKDDRAPKMGVLAPSSFEEVDCLLWAPVCTTRGFCSKTDCILDAIRGRCAQVHISFTRPPRQ